MNEKISQYPQLLKYPILVVSIILGLLAAKFLLGIRFERLTEIGPHGIKFAEQAQATAGAISDLEGRLNEALLEIEFLKERIGQPVEQTAEQQSQLFVAKQRISDQTIKILEPFLEKEGKDLPRLEGFIWLGHINGNWEKPVLADLESGKPVRIAPEEIHPGTEYRIAYSVKIRKGPPEINIQQREDEITIGVIPRGTRIRIIEEPVPFESGRTVQLWARIETM